MWLVSKVSCCICSFGQLPAPSISSRYEEANELSTGILNQSLLNRNYKSTRPERIQSAISLEKKVSTQGEWKKMGRLH